MSVVSKFYYHTWNIGIIENSITNIILLNNNTLLSVNWINHNYRDRFFADPFILDYTESEIQILVEEYPYFKKKGVISLLTVDRKNYNLLKRKVILEQPYHMSYPYIQRDSSGELWVAPEASMGGCLYRYNINLESKILENQEVLLSEPALDSTIIEHDGMYWLFCTKRGFDSNKKLYIYYSNTSKGPWLAHTKNPVVDDSKYARPAGYMVKLNDTIYRFVQKNDISYGETINITKIEELSTVNYKESFVKQLNCRNSKYSSGFHTINGYKDICVVDGLYKDFAPFRRIWFEFRNKFNL